MFRCASMGTLGIMERHGGPVALLPRVSWGEPVDRAEAELVLPVGTVTLLLADVEGSTRLWEQDAEAMRVASAALEATVSDVVGSHHGVRPVEQGEGDSFVAAFARASDAVTCALALQRALQGGSIRLRVGIHTGEVQLREGRTYIGGAVNRCARIRDVGFGGQTLLSRSTCDLVVDRLPAGAWVDGLGTHRLRDLVHPEEIFQLCHPDLPAGFPALRSLDALANNLPVQLTRFVGRKPEIRRVKELLGEARLVTLTGAGGAGKTRLALEVAADRVGAHADGVWFVDLAPMTDGELVPSAVGAVLGLEESQRGSIVDAVARCLATRQLLLVLDNCEHLVDACARTVEPLLKAAPGLSILATSRQPLGIAGEAAFRVPSLDLPDASDGLSGDALAQCAAVELFLDRARAVDAGFSAAAADVHVVAEICRRLDGIPLAIELAAARVRVLSLEEIHDGLDDRFRLLTGGSGTRTPRQQTLRASVDWSHALLSHPERAVFRRLSVFTGGFDLDAARRVATGGDIDRHHVLDLVSLLVDKSLIVKEAGHPARFRLLETIRQYARDALADSGDGDRCHEALAAYALELVEAKCPRLLTGEQDEAFRAVDAELDNIRAAVDWLRQRGDWERLARIAATMGIFWYHRGSTKFAEGRAWLEEALQQPSLEPRTRFEALWAAAYLAMQVWDGTGGDAREEAVALAEELDDEALLRRIKTTPAGGRRWWEEAIARAREALAAARASDDPHAQYLGRYYAGVALSQYGLPDEALEHLEEAARLCEDAGDRVRYRVARSQLGLTLTRLGDSVRGRAVIDDVVHDARASGDRRGLQMGLIALLSHSFFVGDVTAVEQVTTELEALGASYLNAGFRGVAALDRGQLDRAEELLVEFSGHPYFKDFSTLVALVKALRGDEPGAAAVLERLRSPSGHTSTRVFHAQAVAEVALLRGRLVEAEAAVHDGLEAALATRPFVTPMLRTLARVVAEQESWTEATRLLAAASTLPGRREGVIERRQREGLEQRLRAELGDDALAAAWAQGAAMTLDEAAAYARRGRGERKRPPKGWASLTPAEQAVADLVARGLTNAAIAERLFISSRTVGTHLTHIFGKLGFSSRAALAAAVAARQRPG